MTLSYDHVPYGSVPYVQHHGFRDQPFGAVTGAGSSNLLSRAIANVGAFATNRFQIALGYYSDYPKMEIGTYDLTVGITPQALVGGVIKSNANINLANISGLNEAFKDKYNRDPVIGDSWFVYVFNSSGAPIDVFNTDAPITLSARQTALFLVTITGEDTYTINILG